MHEDSLKCRRAKLHISMMLGCTQWPFTCTPVPELFKFFIWLTDTHTPTRSHTHTCHVADTSMQAQILYTYTATSTVNRLDDCDKSWANISGSHAYAAYLVCPNGQGRAPTDHSLEWSVQGTHWPSWNYIDKTHVTRNPVETTFQNTVIQSQHKMAQAH